MPIVAVPRFLLWLLSLVILAAGAWLLYDWYLGEFFRDDLGRLHFTRGPLWELLLGVGLLSLTVLGRPIVLLFLPKGTDEPRDARGETTKVTAPDGSLLQVESFGPADAPTLVLTHGWGLNSGAWWHAKRALAGRFRVVVWDLPGLGRSKGPTDGRYSLDRFAEALCAVVETATTGPVVLVGHSIGGMTTQTFWRDCPDRLRRRVAGLVLIDTTFQNPLRTMLFGKLWLALQKPVIEPLSRLMVLISPLAWLANWQSYLNGTSHVVMRLTGFGRYATRGQVDYTARLSAKGSPAVQAKGNLAMFHWSVSQTLPRVQVPVLVLAGDKDIVTLPPANAHIADTMPGGALVPVEGGGHMTFMERADLVNGAIADFAGPLLAGRTQRGRAAAG